MINESNINVYDNDNQNNNNCFCPCRYRNQILIVDDHIFNIMTMQTMLEFKFNLLSD